MPESRERTSAAFPWRHLAHACAVLAGYTAVFVWLYWRALRDAVYLAESDLYEYFFPIFLSPFTRWSSFEFAGIPAFADLNEPFVYPPFVIFAWLLHSWTGFVIAAHVIAAAGVYLYVLLLTRSKGAAGIAGLAFGMSEAMIERLAHMTTLHAIAWLPYLFICLERLRTTGDRRWIGLGGVVVALVLVSGHPQPSLYACAAAALYALVGALAERRVRTDLPRAAAMFALGGALATVKLLPFVQLTLHMARDTVSFGQYVSHANSPGMMWSTLFPTVLHDGREAPTYVGLAIIVLAIAGVMDWRRNWRVKFWVCATLFTMLLGMGEHTPLARVAFTVLPTYNKFRVVARHLILTSFGLVVLAGYGAAAMRQPGARRTVTALAVFAALVGAGFVYLGGAPDGLPFEIRYPIAWQAHGWPAWLSDALWTQAALAAASVVAVVAWSRLRWAAVGVVLLVIVVGADLLNAQPSVVTWRGLGSVFMPASAVVPSVHADALARNVAPERQRLLAIGGTTRDAVVPATWARIWQIPIAGGYGPMLLDRHSDLSTMGRSGSIRNSLMGPADQTLNLLAVKQLIVQPSDVASSGTFEAAGLTWEREQMDLPVGRPDCDYRYPRRLELSLPGDVEIADVHAVMYLRCAETVPQGQEVGALILVDDSGAELRQPLRAGMEVSELSLTEARVRERAAHRQVALFDDPDAPGLGRTLVSVKVPDGVRPRRLIVTAEGFGGWLTLGRLTLVARDGRMLPQAPGRLYLGDPRRFRPVTTFRTSRYTDRGRDETRPDEQDYEVYENLQARPRAWLTSEVVSLRLDDVLPAIRSGQLPDGRLFDPARIAIVAAEDGGPSPSRFEAGAAQVHIEEQGDGEFGLRVSSTHGGFLVLSETWYPGWRAAVDGASVPVHRANLSLQGVLVPPGSHRVTFTLVPTALYAGGAVSLASLGVCVALMARRRRPAPAAAPSGVRT